MSAPYILFVCIGISNWGCGGWQQALFPTADACFASLERMRQFEPARPATVNDSRGNPSLAYCRPATTKEAEAMQ